MAMLEIARQRAAGRVGAVARTPCTAPVHGATAPGSVPPVLLPSLLAPPGTPGQTGRSSGGAFINGEIRIHQKHLKSIKPLSAVCFPFGEVAARLHGPTGMRVCGYEARGGLGSLLSDLPFPNRLTLPAAQGCCGCAVGGDAAGSICPASNSTSGSRGRCPGTAVSARLCAPHARAQPKVPSSPTGAP